TNSGADNQEDGESNVAGFFKINIIHLNCSVEACEMTFQTKVDHRKHLKAVHKIAPYQCNIKDCAERFQDRYTVWKLDFCVLLKVFIWFRNQLKTHVDDQHVHLTEWSCGHCTKSFKSCNSLSDHIRRYHEHGLFQCGQQDCHFTAATRIAVQH